MQDADIQPQRAAEVGRHPGPCAAGVNQPLLEGLWTDYCYGGMGLGEIAAQRGMSYGVVRKILKQHPKYHKLAAERQREAPAAVRASLFKQIDVQQALQMLRSGMSTRAVSAHFSVCTRTLRKRLLPYPEYRQIIRGRGVSKPNGDPEPRVP